MYGYSFDKLEYDKNNEFIGKISDEAKRKYRYIYEPNKLERI